MYFDRHNALRPRTEFVVGHGLTKHHLGWYHRITPALPPAADQRRRSSAIVASCQKPTFFQLPLELLTLLVRCGGLTQELECQGERLVIFLTCGKVFRYPDVR